MSKVDEFSELNEDEIEFNAVVHGLLLRLERVLETENGGLKSGQQEMLSETASKKMRLLSQLESACTKEFSGKISAVNKSAILALKKSISTNMQKLDLRIRAINQLATTIQKAVREEESDGTYIAGNFAVGVEQE